eukprot:gene4955-6928_t
MESADAPELVPESSNSLKKSDEELWPPYCNPSYRMPDEIEVKVTLPSSETYFFPVSIVKANAAKKYFGGYRNKLNGLIYHHASSQTPTDQKPITRNVSNVRTRETQTYETRTLSIQPYRESGTQMERIDLKLDNKRDVVKYAKSYFTSDELMIVKKAGVIMIQRCWRGYMARCLSEQIRIRNVEFAKQVETQKELDAQISKEERFKDMNRRIHPKTNSDFAVLYNELDSWRREEIKKIQTTITEPEERKVAMSALLENEIKALQSMQKLKVNASKEMKFEKTQQMLEMMAKPQVWQLSHGEVAQVLTPETQRAKELLDLYNALNTLLLTTDQRLEILLNVKWTVNEFDTPITREIKDLVDREADLLNRGRSMKSMEKLRVRLSNLFLEFIEDPQHNPRAALFVKK